MLYLFGKKLGTQHYPTVAGVGYTTPTYEIMDVGCWVHNNQLYKSWLLGTQQPTNFRRCVVLCWFLLVQPMSEQDTKTRCLYYRLLILILNGLTCHADGCRRVDDFGKD